MESQREPVEEKPAEAASRSLKRWWQPLVPLMPLFGLLLVLLLIGWPHSPSTEDILILSTRVVAFLYGALFLVNFYKRPFEEEMSRLQRYAIPAVAVLIILSSLFENLLSSWIHAGFPHLSVRLILLMVAAIQQVSLLLINLPSWIPTLESSLLRRLNPGTILFGTFALLVVLGTLLLKMPNATTGGITWIDALFTSTSAVCVTGLIVVDTATAFTPLGQGIILGLIQLGAFGIVTLTFFLAVVTGQGFSVASRIFLKDVLNLENLRSLRYAVFFLITFTLIIEALGWASLHILWSRSGFAGEDLRWASLFHSVSAFCNAGFSIFSQGLADPIAVSNYSLQGVMMILIILGGIGFPVLMEALSRLGPPWRGGPRPARPTLHFRLALLTTAVLLIGGTLLLFLSHPGSAGESGFHRLWVALFNAVTARTAGFNISDMAALSSAATAVMIFLMFIGGSPGGFAGGIKTTTFALSMLNLHRILLARRDVELFRRRIEESLCNRAFAVMLLSFMWIFAATALILFLQPEFLLLDTLFETVSAFSTVGLSRGITADLSTASKFVIVTTMFVGRIGVMNFFFSLLVVPPKERRFRVPRERIIIE
ncbi:MAG: TrkH family potassium uptake protein [Oceanipulchritudo sp.]